MQEFNMGVFLFSPSLMKHNGHWAAIVIFWDIYYTWERQTALAELQLYQDTTGSKLAS
jgi:hypothetical protein